MKDDVPGWGNSWRKRLTVWREESFLPLFRCFSLSFPKSVCVTVCDCVCKVRVEQRADILLQVITEQPPFSIPVKMNHLPLPLSFAVLDEFIFADPNAAEVCDVFFFLPFLFFLLLFVCPGLSEDANTNFAIQEAVLQSTFSVVYSDNGQLCSVYKPGEER